MGGRLGGRGTSRSIESHGGGKGCDIGCRRRTAPPRRRRRSAALVVVVAALPPSSSSQRRSHLRRHRNCRRRNSRGVKVARQPSGAGGQPRRCSVARQQGGQAALGLLLAGSLLRRIAVLDPATAAVDVGDAAPSPRPSESGKLHAGDLATAAVDAVMCACEVQLLYKLGDNTLDEVKEVVHVKQDAPPPSSFLPNSSVCTYKLHYLSTTWAQVRTIAQVIIVVHAITQGLQSLFVKACGVNISVQVDLSNTKVDYLINSACQKMRVNVKDTYAVLCGKILEYNKPMTFDEKFDDIHANTWFYTVDLVPALQRQTRTNPPVLPWLSVRYFSDFASYNIQKVLNHITAMHWENLSYNGAFNSDNIIFHNGAVTIQGVLTVQFNGVTCAKDFAKLYSIFIAKFTPHGCLHFANNFLKHAQNRFMLHEVEAAFSNCLEEYLPHVLKAIARLAQHNPQGRQYLVDVKQQSGGAANESYLARLMEACIFFVSLDRCSWRDGGMLEYKEKQP
ncbi:Os01g0181900 [Oryza sativa Japonica Group]|uniref:Os01g0181900 protein n=1 Tax=Oryza sativa subsp. japonica TaxID=39947 RepID=C7IXT2_ORYSJ|nr:Os01g0181900 [Oryza sativa Japonica Group]|eukprot:NP_001172207.1 Os01g0181900 [Oryza sativa Japonica Group]